MCVLGAGYYQLHVGGHILDQPVSISTNFDTREGEITWVLQESLDHFEHYFFAARMDSREQAVCISGFTELKPASDAGTGWVVYPALHESQLFTAR